MLTDQQRQFHPFPNPLQGSLGKSSELMIVTLQDNCLAADSSLNSGLFTSDLQVIRRPVRVISAWRTLSRQAARNALAAILSCFRARHDQAVEESLKLLKI
jgi:hypothetical protein